MVSVLRTNKCYVKKGTSSYSFVIIRVTCLSIMLESFFSATLLEAGCDEAGRGCLAGPVCAAAVILPKEFKNEL
jgi:ribonuclease HIII